MSTAYSDPSGLYLLGKTPPSQKQPIDLSTTTPYDGSSVLDALLEALHSGSALSRE